MIVSAIDIVIVNWNTGGQLRECIGSIASAQADRFTIDRVVVVDNASTDGSAVGLEAQGLPLHLIANRENRGFAAACNQGARSSRADYILFLNPDTLLFPHSLERPIAFMQCSQNQSIGICGIRMEGDNGVFTTSCARFPTAACFIREMLGLDRLFHRWIPSRLMKESELKQSRTVDQIIGAFFLVRRHVYEELNGMDERFFLYFEEVDFSFRARQGGHCSYYLADASAYHKGGGSSSSVKGRRLFYSLASRLQYSSKHFSPIVNCGLVISTLLLEPFTRLGRAALKASWAEARSTIEGYATFYRMICRTGVLGWPPASVGVGAMAGKEGQPR